MINNRIRIKVKGELTIEKIRAGKVIEVIRKTNTVTTGARQIVCKCLTGIDNFITKIQAYKSGSPLADNTSLSYSFPSTNQVLFSGIFNEASFNDTLDELRLTSEIGGPFSTVTGLEITKDDTLQLSINWKLTINFD